MTALPVKQSPAELARFGRHVVVTGSGMSYQCWCYLGADHMPAPSDPKEEQHD